MILIISENNDSSTNIVLDWLSLNNKKFIRINDTDKFKISKIAIGSGIENIKLSNSKTEINFNEISVYWHRRGVLNIKYTTQNTQLEIQEYIGLKNYMNSEYKAINRFVLDNLYNKTGVGKIEDNYTNKFSNLIFAKNCGLLIIL